MVAYVSFAKFLFQGVVPLRGKAMFARCGAAHLAVEVLSAYKLHHAVVVGSFHVVSHV